VIGMARWVVNTSLRIACKVSVVGLNRIPLTGSLIVAADHPHSFDAFLIGAVFPRKIIPDSITKRRRQEMKKFVLLLIVAFVGWQAWGLAQTGRIPALENLDKVPMAVAQLIRPDPAKVIKLREMRERLSETPAEVTLEIASRRERVAEILARAASSVSEKTKETITPEDVAYYRSQMLDLLFGEGIIRELTTSVITALILGAFGKVWSIMRGIK